MQEERGAQAGVAGGVNGWGMCSGSCGWSHAGGRCRLTAPRPSPRCTMPSPTLPAGSGATGAGLAVPGIPGGCSSPILCPHKTQTRPVCRGMAALRSLGVGPVQVSWFSHNTGIIRAELLQAVLRASLLGQVSVRCVVHREPWLFACC